MVEHRRKWWKEAVVYQVYPRSFMDSNGDGVGDLQGIRSKLDYLKWLGIDVIWLSPIYESPNDDMGYDISNYQAIMKDFGNMADFEDLLAEAHERGIRILMDLVVNHTSDEHQWFQESRKDKTNPYRDFYIWRSSADGTPPNNWASFFGGSVWELDGLTEEYYLHLFSKKQPDLNWEHPSVRREIFAMMRWWLDKGVDGFRMDVINAISKVPGLPDVPGGEHLAWAGELFLNGPQVHEFIQEMHDEVLSKYDVMTVGETLSVTTHQARDYVGEDRRELNMVFQFELMDIDAGPGGKWDVQEWELHDFKEILSRWQTELANQGWNALYLNNHDQPRQVSRFGNDSEYREASAKMLATLLHTLQGTPFIFQGEELGMTNVPFANIDEYRDIETLNWYEEQVHEGTLSQEEIMRSIHTKSRDNARTPMQWNKGPNAGFSTGEPWIGVNPNYVAVNVEEQMENPDSVLHYYRTLIALRRQHPVLVYGDYQLLGATDTNLFAYVRTDGDSTLCVVLNFSPDDRVFEWPETLDVNRHQLLIGNYAQERDPAKARITLRPYEAQVYISK